MPYTIRLENHPFGYAVTPALEGELVTVCTSNAFTSEDGNDFVSCIEGVSDCYQEALDAANVRPSQVDNLLAIVAPDRTATVYVNELQLRAEIRRRVVYPTPIAAGTPICRDDIADINAIVLINMRDGKEVTIPHDHGVSLILSHRWRKGIFFDYSVFGPEARLREVALERVFGGLLARLVFQERYSLAEDHWRRLFEWGWFPFTALCDNDQNTLRVAAHFDNYPGPQLEAISRNIATDLRGRFDVWSRLSILNQHMEFILRAFERYIAADYLSCLSILLPRIEGVMRAYHLERNPAQRARQELMVTTVTGTRSHLSVLLPARFADYLRRVYFKDFDLQSGSVSLSRHSHGHGVSHATDYDFVRATAGFLTLDQLYYYLSR